MNRTDAPKKQPIAFGVNGPREDLPDTTPSGDNTASYNSGFPPITMTLKSAGGLPPKGQDMNQILYELSSLSRWASSGAINSYDAEFSTAISGYPSGAVLLGDDGKTIYASTINANTNNPNSSTVGWSTFPAFLGLADSTGTVGRLLNIVDFTSSGTYTPNPLAKFIIVIVTGGGGGGGGSLYTDSTHVSVGGGGGGGGTAVSKLKISDITATVAVTVGSAGVGGSSSAIATSGGASSFGAYLTGDGGGFGSAGTAIAVGSNAMTYNGGGSTSSNGNLDNRRGGSGGIGLVCQTNYESGGGGSSYWGAGGVPIAGQGSATAGVSGYRGSGGSGGLSVISTATVMNGGNGGSGFVRIWEYA